MKAYTGQSQCHTSLRFGSYSCPAQAFGNTGLLSAAEPAVGKHPSLIKTGLVSLSRLPPKSVPLLVRVAVGVTGLLAIVDPLFIFHLFCLVFLQTWFSFSSLIVVYLTLCSSHVGV